MYHFVMQWLYWLILAASAVHIVEEYSLGFLAWFKRAIPALAPGMTPGWAVVVNTLFVLLCAWAAIADRAPTTARLVVPCLVTINAILHIAMTIRMREYSPGLVSACVLYIPLGTMACAGAIRSGAVEPGNITLAVLGALGLHAATPLSLRWRVSRIKASGRTR